MSNGDQEYERMSLVSIVEHLATEKKNAVVVGTNFKPTLEGKLVHARGVPVSILPTSEGYVGILEQDGSQLFINADNEACDLQAAVLMSAKEKRELVAVRGELVLYKNSASKGQKHDLYVLNVAYVISREFVV